ncbi:MULTISPECIES: inorganic phosphate transporter [Haloferax]|uniref:Phosphate transporter n=1 Tax=Haloferax marinum TaxID=2666143 RepID=A0A6A8G6Y0_9EURY|nr:MULTISPECIES: inorganic phosphate transporter [Haloferax]KAB1197470.1 inorganic phosphate transporter [Haloferax sp. CBA1150]MRW96515.1 inorganic phosphate transporter [Haloferax marinum]
MVELLSLVLVVVASSVSLFMAWIIGAGSAGATPFAPAVGANAISIMRAGLVVGVIAFLGALVQGESVSSAIGTGLIDGVSLSPVAAVVVLLLAGGLMAAGIVTGIPIATAFTVTGAVIGIGVALGGTPAWAKYQEIASVWVLTPFVGGGLAYGLARLLSREWAPESICIPALAASVSAVVANIEFAMLGGETGGQSLARALGASLAPATAHGSLVVTLSFAVVAATLVRLDIHRDEHRAMNRFLLALGSLVAFSAGGSQVGLAVGPLLPLFDTMAIPLFAVLFGGGVGILVGAWMGAPRMIKSLSQDYSSLGPRRAISALIPSFLIAQVAVFLGVPVSFNEIVVSAIIGSGAAITGGAGISRAKILKTLGAWVGSFVLSFSTGYLLFTVVSMAS